MVTTQKEIEITLSDSGSITKDKFIQLWKQAEDSPLQPRPIGEGHSGSTIDEDGIRICGTLDFIFSVVSRLKDLLPFDDGDLRLGISCSELKDKETGRLMANRFRCAIQVHERGDAMGLYYRRRINRAQNWPKSKFKIRRVN